MNRKIDRELKETPFYVKDHKRNTVAGFPNLTPVSEKLQ